MDDKETYRIQYVDNTYQLVEWDIDQLTLIFRDMREDKSHSLVDRCIFKLNDIRAIIHIEKEPEELETPEGDPIPDENGMIITELGSFEKDVFDLLVQNGIDVGNVIGERRSK